MDDDLFLVLFLFFLLLIVLPLSENEENYEKYMLENYEIIETHINVNRAGINNYFIIVENESGDLIEIETDINTFVKYGGKLIKE